MTESIQDKLTELKKDEDRLLSNPVANFAYELSALGFEEGDVYDPDGTTEYDYTKANNIPTANPSVINTNPSVLAKGFRSQASSITRMLLNHFFGRVSFNLNKTVHVLSEMVTNIKNFLGAPNGIATLDENGRLPFNQLPESAIEFKGLWDASTNTPELSNGMTGATNGDFYIVSTDGTVNFGAGDIQFFVNDRVIYDGTIWSRLSSGDVKTVNGVYPEAGDIKNVITLTKTQYKALDANSKKGKFFIVDNETSKATEIINDNATALDTTWSSEKILANLGENYDTKGNQSIVLKTDANICIPEENTESINYVYYGEANLPINNASHFIRTQRSTRYIVQFASNVQNALTKTEPDYMRKAKLTDNIWTFSPWTKVTTEADLNDALANYQKQTKISSDSFNLNDRYNTNEQIYGNSGFFNNLPDLSEFSSSEGVGVNLTVNAMGVRNYAVQTCIAVGFVNGTWRAKTYKRIHVDKTWFSWKLIEQTT